MGKLSGVKLFLLDMDGTLYIGSRLLPGALKFLSALKNRKIPYVFLTNNSSKSTQDYVAKLAGLGIKTKSAAVLTSGEAAIAYLRQNGYGKDILLVGTPSLEAQFTEAGYRTGAAAPCAAVLGFDTTLTYEKLSALCAAVRAGLPYIATHPDINCPAPGGMIPDIGAVIAFVKAAAGREPDVIIGKPYPVMARMAAERAGVPIEAACMVGDRLYTDIALGACGIKTALVLTGETAITDLRPEGPVPTFIFEGLREMTAEL